MYSLGSRLKKARNRRKLTQKMLADKVNKSVSAISSYESNVQLPPMDVLISLASVLNVSLDYLAGLDNVEMISTKDLQPQQKEFLDLLLSEFASPTKSGQNLSTEQILLVQKLIHLFSE